MLTWKSVDCCFRVLLLNNFRILLWKSVDCCFRMLLFRSFRILPRNSVDCCVRMLVLKFQNTAMEVWWLLFGNAGVEVSEYCHGSSLIVSGHQLTAARLLDGLQVDGSLAAGGGDAIAAISDTELGKPWLRWQTFSSFSSDLLPQCVWRWGGQWLGCPLNLKKIICCAECMFPFQCQISVEMNLKAAEEFAGYMLYSSKGLLKYTVNLSGPTFMKVSWGSWNFEIVLLIHNRFVALLSNTRGGMQTDRQTERQRQRECCKFLWATPGANCKRLVLCFLPCKVSLIFLCPWKLPRLQVHPVICME